MLDLLEGLATLAGCILEILSGLDGLFSLFGESSSKPETGGDEKGGKPVS